METTYKILKTPELKRELQISLLNERENALYNAGKYLGVLNDNEMFIDALTHCVKEYEEFTYKYKEKVMYIEFSKKEFYSKYATLAFAVMYHMNCIGYRVTYSPSFNGVNLIIAKSNEKV